MATKKTKMETLADQLRAVRDTSTSDAVKNVLGTLADMTVENDRRMSELVASIDALTAAMKALKPKKR